MGVVTKETTCGGTDNRANRHGLVLIFVTFVLSDVEAVKSMEPAFGDIGGAQGPFSGFLVGPFHIGDATVRDRFVIAV